MNTYITGSTVKQLREAKGLTQTELAVQIGVSSKAVSKWETAKGLPDISLIEPLAEALGVSVTELMTGNTVINQNISANMLRSKIYVCPVCGNILYATGDAVISCCGTKLSPLEAEETDNSHKIDIHKVEDEHFITIEHEMTKDHYISFIAFITSDRFQLVKFYPEGNAQTRLQLRGAGFLYIYCNKHGLMKQKI
ncbi:MAG: helix-turn-helix domain-containing protein [Eubacterium sp.]